MSKIGVGVVGAGPVHSGSAIAAHIPAIQAVPKFELRAVSTSKRDTADAATRAFGVSAFDNAADLIANQRSPHGESLFVSVPEQRRFT